MAEFKELLEEYAAVATYIDSKEKEIADTKKLRDKIKAALMAVMNDLDISNAKSIAGHAVTLVKNNSAKVVDAEAFYDFVFESGDTSFLTKHVASDAVGAYLDKHNVLPPGVEMASAITLRFTCAKS